MNTSKNIGNIGEDMACSYLTKKGYKIIDRNYHSQKGEIDIIANYGTICVFVEVKLRKNAHYGNPCEAVTVTKQRSICATAEKYIYEKDINTDVRFDIIEICGGKINHIEDAFWGDI